ncbi:4'-phosphopantetheinyl transferase superfamily protein [Bosea vestrisii]|uniref:4'-phosphopantetheinyl transferase family protein n=1 Tax=Bosea vestrisii TaxID=151416 RepID=UPI0024DF7751|nr:4'-phosphopantetheinyl transferase superfamily protein [Bosea vestrisii]WID96687.1 4'-phosphopantetheinyl transferase superfamily protein [Bosea vestrisii]
MMPLPPLHVHLWCCRIDLSAAEAAERRGILSNDERARADRFHDAKARIAFIVARNWLRRVLALYTPVPPPQLRFGETVFGKPFLANDEGGSRLAFNLSHSGELAIVAVTAGMPVGIDIERIRPVSTDLLAGCLAPREFATLSALAPTLRQESFIRCWTRKEACLKAIGVGLNGSPSSFEVSLDPTGARLLAVESDPAEADLWQLADLQPAPGYCGTLAARHRGWSPIWMARP